MLKDASHNHFSKIAGEYQKYRPDYPNDLFQYLAMLCDEQNNAWDVATGTGQSAYKLAQHFDRVYASDISSEQIEQAQKKVNIKYFVGSAEDAKFPDNSLDLISVAQALHWFDIDKFFLQVERVLRPGGILAVWSYQRFEVNSHIDKLIEQLYSKTLEGFWSERKLMINDNYSEVVFPYEKIEAQDFYMEQTWSFEHVKGYLNTWSAVRSYLAQEKMNPILEIEEALKFAWCDTNHLKKVRWPLKLIICRKPEV